MNHTGTREPALTEQVRIRVGGQDLDSAHASALATITVRGIVSTATSAQLEFINPPASGGLSLGDEIAIRHDSASVPLFRGPITAVSDDHDGAGKLVRTVRAYDALQALRVHAPVRMFVELTTAELAGELLGDAAIKLIADADSPVWHRICQWSRSDLALLRDVAGRTGTYFQLQPQAQNPALRLFSAEGYGDVIDLTMGDHLLHARTESNADVARGEVQASAWDPQTSAVFATQAQASASAGLASMQGVVANVAGLTVQGQSATQAHAEAVVGRRQAHAEHVHGCARGNANLACGRKVRFRGLGDAFERPFMLTEVVHRIDRLEGFRTEFATQPPPQTNNPYGLLVTLGEVVAVDDPESLGRVCVSLPVMQDIETSWLQIMHPAAGAGGKGFVAVPDRGDQVLVLLFESDPAHGIVLGGLFGQDLDADVGVEGDQVVQHLWRSKAGQVIRLSDKESMVSLVNEEGSEFKIAPDLMSMADAHGNEVKLTSAEVSIHAATNMLIEAPGKALTIRAASIDFERG
ncbi:MAG: phage baseplate assembly protein V [Pseudomonadota bacterium]